MYNSLVASVLGRNPKEMEGGATAVGWAAAVDEVMFKVTTHPAEKVIVEVDLQSQRKEDYLSCEFDEWGGRGSQGGGGGEGGRGGLKRGRGSWEDGKREEGGTGSECWEGGEGGLGGRGSGGRGRGPGGRGSGGGRERGGGRGIGGRGRGREGGEVEEGGGGREGGEVEEGGGGREGGEVEEGGGGREGGEVEEGGGGREGGEVEEGGGGREGGEVEEGGGGREGGEWRKGEGLLGGEQTWREGKVIEEMMTRGISHSSLCSWLHHSRSPTHFSFGECESWQGWVTCHQPKAFFDSQEVSNIRAGQSVCPGSVCWSWWLVMSVYKQCTVNSLNSGHFGSTASVLYYPARACAARGKVISRGWWCPYVKNLQFFWNQSFISQNTHFQSSISTQTGFSSNLMASGTA